MDQWTVADIEIAIVDEMSAGSILMERMSTPVGELVMMAEIESSGPELVLAGLHIQTETLRPNSLGWARLRQVARVVAEKVDVDAVIVKGAARTTGAHHGRIPGHLRFTRAISPSR
jgi:hypothetical protein